MAHDGRLAWARREHPVRPATAKRLPRLGGVAIQLAISYVPSVAGAFRASALSGLELALVALVALGRAVVAEAVREGISAQTRIGSLT